MHRTIALVALLALAACGSPDPTGPRSFPPRPSLATLTTDVSPAVTPTPVSAAVIATTVRGDGSTVDSIRITWVDNETRLDELNTCAQFQTSDGGPVTTQCAYAEEYDQPAGSTGERSAVVVAPAGVAAFARFWTARFFLIETLPGDFATMSKKSEVTEFIPVSSLETATTTKRRGKK